ncbi:MAG: hypothetical protein MJ174_05695 [Treponema sp.]|nr:hypothetical protein [Treponema sp.]
MDENFPIIGVFLSIITSVLDFILPAVLILCGIGLVYIIFYVIEQKLTSDNKVLKLIGAGFANCCSLALKNLHIIIISVIVIGCLNYILVFGNNIVNIYNKQQKIKELSLVVKNLSREKTVAEITLLKREGDDSYYKVIVFDNVAGEKVYENNIHLKGKKLYVDSIVLNFEYSEIESGNKNNIAFPYRVFSEKIEPVNGILLKTLYQDENDEVLQTESQSALGLSEETYRQRAAELIEIVKDPAKSREMGIRSSHGAYAEIPDSARENDVYIIKVENTGGLSCSMSKMNYEDRLLAEE